MALKLARLNQNIPIVNPVTGNPTPGFLRFWDEFAGQIEAQEAAQAATIADLAEAVAQIQATMEVAQAAAQAANNAQETADGAGGGSARSGNVTDPAVNIINDPWVLGPQVDLTGVSAGDLTITGSGPQQDGDSTLGVIENSVAYAFEFRVVEVILGVDTVLFTGNFTATNWVGAGFTSITNTSASAVSSFSLARSSTGDVSYRIDARRVGHTVNLTSLLLYLFARRS